MFTESCIKEFFKILNHHYCRLKRWTEWTVDFLYIKVKTVITTTWNYFKSLRLLSSRESAFQVRTMYNGGGGGNFDIIYRYTDRSSFEMWGICFLCLRCATAVFSLDWCIKLEFRTYQSSIMFDWTSAILDNQIYPSQINVVIKNKYM